jgi:hypothetical protein
MPSTSKKRPLTWAPSTNVLCPPRDRSKVLPQLIDGARGPHVAHVLDAKRHGAHGPLARPPRGVGVEAVTLKRVLTMSAVRLYLVTKIGVVTRATEEVH